MNEPFIKRIKIKNILSFDDEGIDLEMKPLNVLIGANASGKSNFIKVLKLMTTISSEHLYETHVSNNGGIEEFIWKGSNSHANKEMMSGQKLGVLSRNHLGSVNFECQHNDADVYLGFDRESQFPYLSLWDLGRQFLSIPSQGIDIEIGNIDVNKDKIDYIADNGENVRVTSSVRSLFYHMYQNTTILKFRGTLNDIFDRGFYNILDVEILKRPFEISKQELEKNYLLSDARNLAVVISRLDFLGMLDKQILPVIKDLYSNVEAIKSYVDTGMVHVALREKGMNSAILQQNISAGILRLIALLTILHQDNPPPPPFICLEELENGFHPEVIPIIAENLIKASEKTQIFVTTHSPELIDHLSDMPECVVVCERNEGKGTKMNRLDSSDLVEWLEEFSLGEVWLRGFIGGTKY